MIRALQEHMISSAIESLIENDRLDDFLKFGREKAKEEGMDTESLMKFFDEIEEKYGDSIDWAKVKDITQKVTGCKVKTFKGDKCLIIENEELSDNECINYINDENVAKIDLEHINNALKVINVKLEFIDALLLPFDADGFQNICRFKVVKLD